MSEAGIDKKLPTIMTGSKALESWKSEIRQGIRYRRMYGKSNDWKRYRNMYRGFWPKGIVPVNIIYAIGRSLIPQIYFRNPRVSIKARKPGYTMHARMLERIDNLMIKQMGMKEEMKTMILHAYLCGVGPMVSGYDTEFGFNPSFNPLDEFAGDSSLTSFSKSGNKIEYTDNVKPGMPWSVATNPSDFIVPWGTRKWGESRWFAFRKMRMLRDIKDDPTVKNKANLRASFRSTLESTGDGTPNATVEQRDSEAANQWVELWQIHDKRTGRVFLISLDHDKFLRDEFDDLQMDNLPGDALIFNEDPEHFWCAPDARLLEVQQNELNDIRTMAKYHRKVAVLKILYDKNGIGPDELVKLLDNDIKAAIGIDIGSGGDIRKVVSMLQSHVPPDLTIAAREVREDVREIAGFSRNQSGSFEAPSGRRTAHEAEIVRAASMIRVNERRDAVADLLERTVMRANQQIFKNWTSERVIDVVGDNGAKYWIRFTGKELMGDFTYGINPEETIPEDQRTRKADALELIGMAAKVPGLNMQYLMRTYASQFDWLDPLELMPGEGPGRSPEKAMQFNDFMRMGPTGQSSFPGLGGQG